ncbi:hypothetical protein PIB30_057812 [Stylosanthes scabra]|uniref:Uncharacterized protein n=1 Tax=Stylosanthes scabra TaxID=79078 RepID=A0ABU6ZIG1_9FABA|nr:hypothetical protein [Stylosanthes scabra]
MKEDERIEEALGRFSRIFNGLNMLGTKYPEREIITKVLRSLTSKWLSKANAIVEGVHYQNGTLTFDKLRGNLITYEMCNTPILTSRAADADNQYRPFPTDPVYIPDHYRTRFPEDKPTIALNFIVPYILGVSVIFNLIPPKQAETLVRRPLMTHLLGEPRR